MKKKLPIILGLPLLLGMVSCSGNDALKIVSTKTADVYMPKSYEDGSWNYSAGKVSELDYAVTNRYGEKEAFVSINSVLGFLEDVGSFGTNPTIRKTGEVGTSPISFGITGANPESAIVTINAENGKVTFSDYDVYRSLGSEYMIEVCSIESLHGMKMKNNEYSSGVTNFTFDLASYGIDILKRGEDVYMPVYAASSLFLVPFNKSIMFNGDAFYSYEHSDYMFQDDGSYTDFAKSYYGGSLKDASPSQEVAELHGNESMFFLDHFYGFPDREDFNGRKFSEYLKEEHKDYYDLFFSNGKEDSQKAWDYLARTIVGDGHTGTSNDLGSFYTGGSYTPEAEWTKRRDILVAKRSALREARKTAFDLEEDGILPKERMFEIHDDMAVIRFDGFKANNPSIGLSKEQYYENIENDLYSLFAYSFMEIEDHPEVKKVVFDITCNSGGDPIACTEGPCFLSNEAGYTIYNPLTGAFVTSTYSGILPSQRKTEGTSYQGKYDFYVLTSGFSFSASNIFANVCKNYKSAKIIGEKSGGGACMESWPHTPDGQWLQISSPSRFCLTNTKESNDGGIEVDISLDASKFYDMEALRVALA